ESLNGAAATDHLDNPGAAATPFYDPNGVSNIGAINSWLFDIPYDCENGLTGEVQANQPTCLGGIDETLLRSAVDFQTSWPWTPPWAPCTALACMEARRGAI